MVARSIARTTLGSTARSIGGRGGAGGVATYDTDAQTYITAVEAADGEALEAGVKDAINAFVVGCKDDEIWDAIKASCILAGARTLDGALVPLKGTAPTNINFVSGDYSRTAGLTGNGTTKAINTNRLENADPQNNFSMGVWVTGVPTFNTSRGFISGEWNAAGSESALLSDASERIQTRCRNASSHLQSAGATNPGFKGISRSTSTGYTLRCDNSDIAITSTSSAASTGSIHLFCRLSFSTPQLLSNARIAYYWIGEALNQSLLESRFSTLLSAIGPALA